jgi:hypothetical protein
VETRYAARPHQLRAIKSEKQLTFLGAGVGSGKTDCGAICALDRIIETPEGVLGLIAANTYSQLYDATLRNFYKNLARLGWEGRVRPRVLSSSHQPMTMKVWNGERWVEILCRSLDNFESLSGVEIGWFWMDEVWQTKKEAFDIVNARMRDTRMRNRGLLTTTLDDPTSWMYEIFVDGFNEKKMEVIYATTYDNLPNLPEDYIDRLKETYSPRLFKRMVMARWVSLESGQIYYAFDRAVHLKEEAEYVEGIPVCWSLDFNIGQNKPMSSCLGQIKRVFRNGFGWQREMHWFDEIILDSSDTNDAVEEASARLRNLGVAPKEVRVYGDRSGKSGDSRSKKTDYKILAEAGFTNQNVPEANPPIRDRHNSVNSLLRNQQGAVRMLAHPRCKTIAKGMETVRLKKGAAYLEEETREQHVTTAVGYLVHKEFPILRPNLVTMVNTRMGGGR